MAAPIAPILFAVGAFALYQRNKRLKGIQKEQGSGAPPYLPRMGPADPDTTFRVRKNAQSLLQIPKGTKILALSAQRDGQPVDGYGGIDAGFHTELFPEGIQVSFLQPGRYAFFAPTSLQDRTAGLAWRFDVLP